MSNSSSSSFVIYLPETFNKEDLFSQENIDRIKNSDCFYDYEKKWFEEEGAIEKAKKALDILLELGIVATSDPYYNETLVIDSPVLHYLLKEYEETTIQGGSDDASWMILVDKSRSTNRDIEEIKKEIKSRDDDDEMDIVS